MVGRIIHHRIVILIDEGNTHNFVQEHLVKSFGLIAQPTPTLRVLIGNGNEVQSSTVCHDVVVHVQGRAFTVDLHVLPLCGADVVLRVQWLKSLGLVMTDYSTLSMKFIYEGTLIELKGDSDAPLTVISPPQLRHLTQTWSASEYFHIRVCSQDLPTPIVHPDIIKLTNLFSFIFQTPTSLPPSRTTNHSIHLAPNSSPVNVRPYSYPHFQKQEIES